MKIAVLGTGLVGTTLTGGLASLGHTVDTRDPQATLVNATNGQAAVPVLELKVVR
ncbi:MAG TPA: hypothetical protein VFG98_09775 [Intrasporangium sp.]|nr:hypothetical protein [Intrasporangium sp.]